MRNSVFQLPSALPPSRGLPGKREVFFSNTSVSVSCFLCISWSQQGKTSPACAERAIAQLLHFITFLLKVMAMSGPFLHCLKSQERQSLRLKILEFKILGLKSKFPLGFTFFLPLSSAVPLHLPWLWRYLHI